jgi:hypothetical protein
VAVILVYPDNPGAITSITSGWSDKNRPSVLSRLEGFKSIYQIAVSDETTISENDLWVALQSLHQTIISLQKENRRYVIFDSTHSYRHLSFAGFIEALFLSDLLSKKETIYLSGDRKRKTKIFFEYMRKNYNNGRIPGNTGIVDDKNIKANNIEKFFKSSLPC